MAEVTAPAPGIYPGMSFADYLKIPAMNCSTLAWCEDSTDHLRAAIDGKLSREDSADMAWGRALHIRLLEPARYAEAVQLRGSCSAIIKSGKRKGEACGASGAGMVDGQWFCGIHGGEDASLAVDREYLTSKELAAIDSAAAAVKAHDAEKIRRAHGMFEVVAIAEVMGVMCKVRLDKWIPKPATIVDVKKVGAPTQPGTAITPKAFANRIDRYHYGMQAGGYCEVMEKLTGQCPRWFWLLVEDDAPHKVHLVQAGERCLAAGRTQFNAYLDQYKRARESDWANTEPQVHLIDGPEYWLNQWGQSKPTTY